MSASDTDHRLGEDLEDELRSPPSWEKVAAMAGQAESDSEDECTGHQCHIARDYSVDNVANLGQSVVSTGDILDLYLQSTAAERGLTQDPDVVFHEDNGPNGVYITEVLKGCLTNRPLLTRKCVVIEEANNVQKFMVENVGECDVDYYDEPPKVGGEILDQAEEDRQRELREHYQRSRTPSDSRDSESVYDTVSSTSSAAPLLRKITQIAPTEYAEDPHKTKADDIKAQSNSIESLGKILLSKTLEHVKKSLEDLSPTHEAEVLHQVIGGTDISKVSRMYLKNLTMLSICFMILYTAFFALRNLQSSIHHEDGLGLAGLSASSGTYISCCIIAPSIVQKIRPKYTILIAMGGHLLYELANFYPCTYTLIPASILLGGATASLWVAQGTYLTSIAATYASITGKKHEGIIGLFNGFFLFWLQFAMILGNLMSSFVFNLSIWKELEGGDLDVTTSTEADPLTMTKDTMGDDQLTLEHWMVSDLTNSTTSIDYLSQCGPAYCHSYTIEHDSTDMGRLPLYILLSIFMALTLLAMCLVACFLDKLDVIFVKKKTSVRQQLAVLVNLHKDYKIWLLCLILVFEGMQQAYTFGEVTKAFVTCSLGLNMIGYVMVCFGACDSLASFVIGQLQRCISTKVFMTVGAILHLGLFAAMLLWKPAADDSKYLIFVLSGSLGVVDAIWQTQMCNVVGFLYPKDREAAFASLRMYEGIGFVIAYAIAQYLCMAVKTYILIGVLIVGMINFYIMEYLEYRRKGVMSSYPPVDV